MRVFLTHDDGGTDLTAAARLMPAARVARWERRSSEVEARNLVVSYWLARYALSVWNPALAEVGWQRTPLLKPFVPGVEFNMSASGVWAMCAVGHCEVGVDVQQIQSIDLSLLATLGMNVAEHELIAAADDPASAFTRLWTMKESYTKCMGEGIHRDFATVDLPTLAADGGLFDGRHIRTWEARGYWFSVCGGDEGGFAPEIVDVSTVLPRDTWPENLGGVFVSE